MNFQTVSLADINSVTDVEAQGLLSKVLAGTDLVTVLKQHYITFLTEKNDLKTILQGMMGTTVT